MHRWLVTDVYDFHLSDISGFLGRGTWCIGGIGQAIKVAALGCGAPKKTEVPVLSGQFIMALHAGFKVIAPQMFMQLVSIRYLQRQF
jgi:hypothetical protein